MNEKEYVDVTTDNGATEAEREKDLVNRKGSVIGEAAVLYGDLATAEEYGYVARGLKSRHIQFIALGGTIGTGLFLGIGSALYDAGPAGIFMGYTITGIFIWMMMQSLGEMIAWLPLPGAIPQMCARYADPALGFAAGWNQWYSCALTQCSEISAAATLIAYWNDSINPGAWIAIVCVLTLALNIFAVQIYGEAEFCFASIKIITLVGLLILALIIDVGGVPGQPRLGFHYWNVPGGALREYIGTGSWGRFLAFFHTLVNAVFSYGGVEIVAVAAGEAENPRVNLPKAVRRVFWRILFFYSLGALAVGVLVGARNPRIGLYSDGRSSPWVIAVQNAGIDVLPSIVNAVIFTSACSSGNAFLYSGARYLFGLAQNGQAPRFFLKCSKRGLPWVCVLFTWVFSFLTFMSCTSGASAVFGWFQAINTVSSLWTWIAILIAALRFQKAIKAQGVSRDELPFKSSFQPYVTWAALIFFSIITLFAGWTVFCTGHWDAPTFVTSYIGTPLFIIFFLFWKFFKRTKWVRPEEADLWTGKAAIDSQVWPERVPRNFLERVWFWIA